MLFILSKNNRLAEFIAAFYFDAPLHQILQNHINCLFIEYKLIQLCGRDKVRHLSVFCEIFLVPFFIFI